MDSKKLKLSTAGVESYNRKIESKEEELKKLRLYKGTDAIYQGDNWHDNPILYQTELKEMSLMKEIARLKKDLLDAEIVDPLVDDDMIDVGDIVRCRIIFGDNDVEENILKLVAATPDFFGEIKEVSINSPLGNAIYKKRVGDKVCYNVENNTFNIEILSKINEKDLDNGQQLRHK